LPGYIGHNVERRKQIQSMKSFAQRHGLDEVARYAAEITADELANRCDAWAENRYFYRKHGGLENKSPAEQLALSGYSPQFIDTDMLRLFLAPPANGGHRVIAKKGVTVESANFVHPLMRSMIGTRIFIRLDEDDLGMVHCFAEDGLTFLFTAENSRRKGEGRELVATAFAEQMADRAEEKRKEIGKLKRKMAGKDIQRLIQNGQAPANLHVLHNMGGADNNIKGGATSLLGREDRAHALVKTPLDNPPAGAQHKQDAGCKAPHIIELPETAAHRWQKAKNLWKLIDEGFSLSPDETAWLKEYSATPEYTKRKQREDLITNKNNPPDSASNTIGRTE
ncbi:MAG: Mu transposase C-terminal domain-containing protein, partial [Alphaproteobacteria bacterium]|nr:Mu transposase C-terminal domain-containing protein [Alphaproteobacteria bacterium]